MYQVKKRNGDLEMFELSKIKSAITRTFEACGRNYQDSIVETLAIKSVANAEKKIKDNVLSVEDIQDSVESILMGYGYEDVSKAYILYRKQHEKARNAKETVLDYKKTIEGYTKAKDWRVKENASIDFSLGGLILGNSGAVTANYWLSEIYDNEIANAHRNCDIHIHDLSMLSAYCNGASLKQLIKEGLGGVPRKIASKPASHLSTLCNQIVNFMGVLSLEFAGAQALSSVDTYLAPFVKVDNLSYKEVRQCIQSLVFGLNTPSRWGCTKVTTKIATPNGFKSYNELDKGDTIYTYVEGKLNTSTLNSVIVKKNDCGEIHTYYGNNYVQTVTPEHRCIVKISDNETRIIRSSELCKLVEKGYPIYVPVGVTVNDDGTVSISENQFIKIDGVRVSEYNGDVWCPSTDDGTAIYMDEIGNIFISGNCQPVFSNFTIDWTVPDDLAELNCIVGGKEVDFKYKDCKREMDMINKAFLEVMIEGDADGRSFAYPILTYSITKDFDWDEEVINNQLLFEMTAKYGIPYFSNYINSDMSPQDTRSMCCRLRLNLRELRRKNGGYFGSGDQTGSIGVVTINMPRLAYKSKDETDFYNRLGHLMDICSRSLEIKRKVVSDLLEDGLYPYTKKYLGNFDNHFSTIATNGMNEMCLNACWIKDNIASEKGYEFSKNVLDFMRNKLSDYQEQTGNLYNIESAPAESTCYRFALHDKKDFPDIITAGDKTTGEPYYTNSSNLPVGYTDDIFEALDHQDGLQTKYTGGTVFHAFLGERLPSWQSAMMLTRKIAENYKLPYFTFSPTYSICPEHGYITGEEWTCPHCGKATEVYSRVTGYYRAVQNFNDGKAHEFKDRKEYKFDSNTLNTPTESECESCKTDFTELPSADFEKESSVGDAVRSILADTRKPMLFTTATCPNCKMAKKFIADAKFDCDILLAEENQELVKLYEITSAPTLIVFDNGSPVKIQNVSNIRKFLDENR